MGIEIRLYDKTEKFVLAVSRWVDGFYLQLVNEPMRLREIGYLDGNWLFLQQGVNHDSEIIQAPIKQIFDDFLVESIEAFF